MFTGVEITLDGEKFILPALSLGQLRSGILTKLQQHDELIKENKIFEAVDIRADVVFAALKRNYPDFPEQKFMDGLDLSNIAALWQHVLGLSGFKPGEVQAATETVVQSGT